MNAITAAMERSGGKAGRYCWNAKAGKNALAGGLRLGDGLFTQTKEG